MSGTSNIVFVFADPCWILSLLRVELILLILRSCIFAQPEFLVASSPSRHSKQHDGAGNAPIGKWCLKCPETTFRGIEITLNSRLHFPKSILEAAIGAFFFARKTVLKIQHLCAPVSLYNKSQKYSCRTWNTSFWNRWQVVTLAI